MLIRRKNYLCKNFLRICLFIKNEKYFTCHIVVSLF